MPFLPVTLPITITALMNQGKNALIYDIEILHRESEARISDGVVIYRGGVVVKYGPTTLMTDTLVARENRGPEGAVSVEDGAKTYQLNKQEAFAVGNIKIIDPDATISVDDLWFTWREEPQRLKRVIARANNFYTKIDTAWIRAQSAELDTEGWKLKKIAFSTSDRKSPYYQFKAESLDLFPGKQGKAKKVTIQVLGQNLPTIPTFTFSLDRRQRFAQIPQVSLRQREGLGLSWGGNIVAGPNSQYTAAIAAFPNILPVYGFAYNHSNVSAARSGNALLQPFGEMIERSPFSFFSNIYMYELENVHDFMRLPRDSYSIGTAFNQATFGRLSDRIKTYNRPVELTVEKGGPIGAWGSFFQARAQMISELGRKPEPRLGLVGSVSVPVAFKGRMTAAARIDTNYLLDSSPSGWVGGEGGVSYDASDKLQFSAGAYAYRNFGNPLFLGDQFFSNQGISLRTDISGKATNFSILFRYDPDHGWFDREYRFAQVVGPIQPVIVYRQNPQFYQIGLNFRIEQLVGLIQNRDPNRRKTKANKK